MQTTSASMIFDGTIIWVYRANLIGVPAHVSTMRLVTRRRVKDAVLSDLSGLPVSRITESVSASRSTLQWRAVTVDGASKREGSRIKRNAIIVRVRHRSRGRTWLLWKKGEDIFIRMFNSANVPHWIPSAVHSTNEIPRLTFDATVQNCP